MDADDDVAMTYFLPGGITDDSPPRKSHMKAHFGPLRTATSSVPVSSSGASNLAVSKTPALASNVAFRGLEAQPPALQLSPFRSTRSPASPHQPFSSLLSDFKDTIYTPQVSQKYQDSTRQSTTRYGLNRPKSPMYYDATNATNAISEAAESFSMDNRSARTCRSRDLYHEERRLSFLDKTSSPFHSDFMQPWQSSNIYQLCQELQYPPGLTKPPGQNVFDMTGNGEFEVQDREHEHGSTFFNSFHSLRTSSSGKSRNRAYLPSKDSNDSRLVPTLRLSSDINENSSRRDHIGQLGGSNSGLAELNAHSMSINERKSKCARQNVDFGLAAWNDQAMTSNNRFHAGTSLKIPRRLTDMHERSSNQFEGRSELRAEAFEYHAETKDAFHHGLAKRVQRSGHHTNASIVRESPFKSEVFGHKFDRIRDKQCVPPATWYTGEKSSRGSTNQSNDFRSDLTASLGREKSEKPTSFAPSELKRRKDTKAYNRSISKRNNSQGTDRTTFRRQVYREKYAKDATKEHAISRDVVSHAALPLESFGKCHEKRKSQTFTDVHIERDQKDTKGRVSPVRAQLARVEATTPRSLKECGGKGENTMNRASDDTVEKNVELLRSSSEGEDASTCRDIPDTLRDASARKKCNSISAIDEHESVQGAEKKLSAVAPTESVKSVNLTLSEKRSKSDNERTQASTEQQRASLKKQSKKKAIAVTQNSLPVSTKIVEYSYLFRLYQILFAESEQDDRDSHREKFKKDRTDKKKLARGKKDKRKSPVDSTALNAVNGSTTEAKDKLLKLLALKRKPFLTKVKQGVRKGSTLASASGLLAYHNTRQWIADRLILTGFRATTLRSIWSITTVALKMGLLLSLHAASGLIRIHRVAFHATMTHRHIGICFAIVYGYPLLIQYVFSWAPPWVPVCLWYAFLVQLFCTNGPTAMVTASRVLLPLVFLIKGLAHHSFLLDLNGSELLLISFIVLALKTRKFCNLIFFLSLATQPLGHTFFNTQLGQCLLAVCLGPELLVQWLQLTLALYSLHAMAATDDEWVGSGLILSLTARMRKFGMEDKEENFPCQIQHSIADYNYHPVPSSAISVQKTKCLDRRAMAYARGRKAR
ncbi:hypothetical protein CCR75_004178 [Bremia lactucae]|uniref:Transmembrane protein n=1 Tax=Bremia lactucae TaxID=4779 RepID=A0A976FLP0_BRELC|nr:hypothetical protein CCR75_004178 [Bremia lactucae]